MPGFLGDFLRGDNVDCWWDSQNSLGGAAGPTSGGTIFVCVSNSSSGNTQVGVTSTLTVFTGINVVRVSTASAPTFYLPERNYSIVLSGASVDGQLVNKVLGQFSIEYRYETGLIQRGTALAGGSSFLSLAAAASSVSSFYDGCAVLVSDNTGSLQGRTGASYAGATKSLTMDRNFITAPAAGSTYRLYAGSPSLSSTEIQLGLPTTTILNSGVTVTSLSAAALSSITAGLPTLTQLNSGVTVTGLAASSISSSVIASGAFPTEKFTVNSFDKLLARGHDATSNTTRRVQDAFGTLLNKIDATGSIGTVYQRDDATSLYTFSKTTAAFPLASIDPAG